MVVSLQSTTTQHAQHHTYVDLCCMPQLSIFLMCRPYTQGMGAMETYLLSDEDLHGLSDSEEEEDEDSSSWDEEAAVDAAHMSSCL